MEAENGADLERLAERIHRISHRLMFCYDAFMEKMSDHEENLSNLELSILFRLYQNPQMIMRDLSEALHVSKSSVTGIVDHLEELGYLRRVLNRNDRRSYALEITEKGKTVQLRHEKSERQAFLNFIEAMKRCGVSEAYLDQTETLLDQMEKR